MVSDLSRYFKVIAIYLVKIPERFCHLYVCLDSPRFCLIKIHIATASVCKIYVFEVDAFKSGVFKIYVIKIRAIKILITSTEAFRSMSL